ncbi:GerAB/ArcD/ProY family transporter [Paenibacillus pini]|uniref:Spore germination protein XB n=1 Tax=Paenibacillus pini JCM 16418 TaxID=1236976 RepID=W7YH08_9BACL|nr:endospore germination permease [Paenibacillus pini]GAF07752.1 hypothetical protein JCM16418_1780 [Paenibacillus pini JCM 16418]
MKSGKPHLSQGFMIILLSIGIMNHVFIIPVLLQTAKRDAWISVLISIIPLMIVTTMIYYISRQMKEQSLEDWIKNNFGNASILIFRILMTFFFTAICLFTLFDTTNWARVTFLAATPTLMTSLFLLGLCLFAVISGFKPIAVVSGILLPFVVLLGFFIMTVNVQYKDYSQLLPILENGWGKVWKGVIYSCAGSFEILAYLFMQSKLAKPAKAWQLYMLAFFLIGLTLGPLIGAITIFDPMEAERQRYPAYEEWRIATLGRYISQTDFFSIYQWLSGSFIRISLALYLMVDQWNIKSKQRKNLTFFAISLGFLFTNLLPANDMIFLNFLKKWYFPASFVFMTAFVVILFLLAFIASRKKVQKE